MSIHLELHERGLFALIKLLGYSAVAAYGSQDKVEAEILLHAAINKMFVLKCAEEQIKEDGKCVALIEAKTKSAQEFTNAFGPWKQLLQDLYKNGIINRAQVSTVEDGKYAQYVKALFSYKEGE